MEISEKRSSPRVPVFIKVKTEYKNLNYSFSYAKNISASGMALENRVMLDSGIKITTENHLFLKFKLPNGRFYIETEAEIVRITDNSMIAVKFINMDTQFVTDIENYVKNL